MKSGALALAAVLAFGVAPASAATTIYVDDGGTDEAGCGTPTAPCKTIQYGIDLTTAGDSVLVGIGTYNECITVVPGTGAGQITVVAAALESAQSVGESIVDGAGVCDTASGTPGPVVTVADQSVFSGFAVKNGGDAGIVGLGAVIVTNNIVMNNETPGNGGGIRIATGSYLTDPDKKVEIRFNSVHDNTAGGAGAGMFVDASASGVPCVVEIQGNAFDTNIAGQSVAATGGGLAIFTGTTADDDVSSVTLIQNIVNANTAGDPTTGGFAAQGAGVYAATGGGTGLGTESIVIGGSGGFNSIRNNVVQGLGGGIAAVLRPVAGGRHSIVIDGNTVTANTADAGGGGIFASTLAQDCATGESALTIVGNSVIGNHVTGDPTDPATAGGGGILADYDLRRTPDGVVALEIARNGIRNNDATTAGGGASVLLSADDDPDLDGAVQPTSLVLTFENNLVATNASIDADGGAAVGGGVAVHASATGALAQVTATQRFLTVIGNRSDTGAGGISWSATTAPDTVSGPGSVAMELSNSILQGNDGFALGGSIVPGATIAVAIDYNDAFENVVGDYEPQLGASTGTDGNVAVDPVLDFLYVPPLCSPTVDLGDPALPATDEPLPNGNRVNIGHLGNTVDATRTFPDVNGDGLVDGVDILGVAVSFASASGDPRYFIAADRDLNDVVDGADLAYVSAFFAQTCPVTGAGTTP